jgi:hypothetical protein
MTAIRMTHPSGAPVTGFRAWRRERPLVGGILLALAGVEMFFSGQLDLGNIHISMGFEGFQATVIPALLAVLGILAIVTPSQHLFYGIFALVLAVYSLVGVNLGGFLLGMLLGAVGGVLVVAWRARAAAPEESAESARSAEPAAETARVAAPTGQPAHRAEHGAVVHAEALDYATLKARAEARRRGAGTSSPKRAPGEPRPFVAGRS